jgi:hypothetical protein
MSKAKSGGGATGKNVRNVGVRTGSPTANKVSPQAVSGLGLAKGNHAETVGTVKRPPEPLVTGRGPQVPLGNAVAQNVGKGGPGAGRVVHARGSQGQHGPVAGSPQPQGRDILSDFSPRKGDR